MKINKKDIIEILVFIVILGIAFAFIWTPSNIGLSKGEKASIAAIEEAGGKVEIDYLCSGAICNMGVSFANTSVITKDFRHLKSLAARLDSLNLSGTLVKDYWLRELVSYSVNIQSMDLSNTNISDAGVIYICCQPLFRLNLSNTKITDLAIECLAATQIRNESKLMGLRLTELILSKTMITDRCVNSLKVLIDNGLRTLNIEGTAITDNHVTDLEALLNQNEGNIVR